MSTHPSTIGRFKVESVLGTGGMGAVYKGFDPTLQRVVAVKTVRPDAHDPELLERLLREAQACARLKHPNVVTIYEAGEIEGTVYVAMEYLAGDNLLKVLAKGGLPFEETLKLLIQVLDALESVHQEGVIHRDIKPANIHRQLDGSIKLVDFGLARTQQAEQMTMTGVVLGTPAYASPEQLKAEPVDYRTDIYSTGVVAYEMITGHRPFTGDIASLFYKVVHEDVPPMSVKWSREFPRIEAIVRKAMSKAPGDRFQSAAEMRQELQAFLAESRPSIAAVQQGGTNRVAETQKTTTRRAPDMAPAPTVVATGARPVAPTLSKQPMWIAAAAAIVVLLLLGGWLAMRGGDAQPAGTSGTPSEAAAPVAAPPTNAPVSAPPVVAPPVSPPVSTPAAAMPPSEPGPTPADAAPARAETASQAPAAPAPTVPAAAPRPQTAGAPATIADASGDAPSAAPTASELDTAGTTANGVGAGGADADAQSPGVRRGGAGGRGQAARGRTPVAQTPRERVIQEERCRRLVERVTLGEVLSPQDRVFLRNCAAGRANGNR